MKLHLLVPALVALAGAFITQSVQAQYTAQANDLILSFVQTGATNDVQVDLGNITQFTAATPTFMPINLNQDLTNQFGSNWFSSSTLSWNVVGANITITQLNGYPKHSTFVSDPGTAFAPFSVFGLATPASVASELYSPTNPTAGVAANTDIVAVNSVNSAAIDLTQSENYNVFSSTVTANFGTGTTSTMSLDLLRPNSSSLVITGVFQVDSTGTVSFTPEPSTSTLLLLGALFLVLHRSRRKSRLRMP